MKFFQIMQKEMAKAYADYLDKAAFELIKSNPNRYKIGDVICIGAAKVKLTKELFQKINIKS